jgi:hypothetical protein
LGLRQECSTGFEVAGVEPLGAEHSFDHLRKRTFFVHHDLAAAITIDEEFLAALERIFALPHFVHHQYYIDLKHAKMQVCLSFH